MTALTRPVPLRTTDVWGRFERPQPIPIGFGRVNVIPVPYDDSGRRYVWLDGVNGGVDEVRVDGDLVHGWESRNGLDITGSPVTFLEFDRAQNGEIHAKGRGRKNTTNPADIIAVILGLSGITTDLHWLRSQTANYSLSGVIYGDQTSRAEITGIVRSVGMEWSMAMPDFAAYYPGTSSAQGECRVYSGNSVFERSNMATTVRVLFDYDFAEDRFKQVVQYHSPNSELQYGKYVEEVQAPWLQSLPQAASLGLSHINAKSRPRWTITGTTKSPRIALGNTVTISDPNGPCDGQSGVVRNIKRNREGVSLGVTIEANTGIVNPVDAVTTSEAFTTDPSTNQVIRSGDEVIITATDENGAPMSGVTVTHVTSGFVNTSDGAGRAFFPSYLLPPGTTHQFKFERTGYSPVLATLSV